MLVSYSLLLAVVKDPLKFSDNFLGALIEWKT